MTNRAKTIRNPTPRENIASYTVTFSDGTSKEVKGIGGTNAWFMSRVVWPDKQIISVEESVAQ
jgi:hypothetical protein